MAGVQRTDNRRQKTEDRKQITEDPSSPDDFRLLKLRPDTSPRQAEVFEFGLRPIGAYAYAPVGIGTRRRPIGRDSDFVKTSPRHDAAANDAECGIK